MFNWIGCIINTLTCGLMMGLRALVKWDLVFVTREPSYINLDAVVELLANFEICQSWLELLVA